MESGDKPRVKDYMTRDVQTVSGDDTVADVARAIAESLRTTTTSSVRTRSSSRTT
jgi:CBS domain-containing protein